MSRKILVRGSLNVDEVFTVEHIVKPGQTIACSSLARHPGGKGANVATAAARAGADVDFCGAAGTDAQIVLDAFGSAGVGTSHLHIDGDTPTGRAIIQVERESGENSIVIVAGANALSVTLPTLDKYAVLLCQNEVPLDETSEALRRARASNVTTLFNPSPMPTAEQIRNLPLHCVDYIVLNEEELEALAAALDTPSDRLLSHADLAACCGIVATQGSRGAFAIYRTSEDGRPLSVAAPRVDRVVDSTGAGDCFTGYLAAAISRFDFPRKPSAAELERAISHALHAATLSVTREGAMASYPSAQEVVKFAA